VDVLVKLNPSNFIAIEETMFEQSVFASTDPLYIERARAKVAQEDNFDQLSSLYEEDPERGGRRLLEEYNVPPEFVPIVEAAHNLDNKIYFIGLNEYDIRQIIASYMNLG
jgi:hypothetical protein